jgi:hypothetical protein
MDAQNLTNEIQDLIKVGKPLEYDEAVSNNYLKPLQKLLKHSQNYFNREADTRAIRMKVYQRYQPIEQGLRIRPYYNLARDAYLLQVDLVRMARAQGKLSMAKDIMTLFVPREGSDNWSPAAHKLFLTAITRTLQQYEKELESNTSDEPMNLLPGPFDRPVTRPQPQSTIPGPFDRPAEPSADTLNAQLLGGETQLPAALASSLVLLRQTGIPLSAIYEATLGNSKFRNHIVRVGASLVGLAATVALLTWLYQAYQKRKRKPTVKRKIAKKAIPVYLVKAGPQTQLNTSSYSRAVRAAAKALKLKAVPKLKQAKGKVWFHVNAPVDLVPGIRRALVTQLAKSGLVRTPLDQKYVKQTSIVLPLEK